MAQGPDKRTYGGFRTAYEYRKWVGGPQFSSKAQALPKLLAQIAANPADTKRLVGQLKDAYVAYLRESEKKTERILGGVYAAFGKMEKGLQSQVSSVQKRIKETVNHLEHEGLVRQRIKQVGATEKKSALQYSIYAKNEARILAAELSTLLVRGNQPGANKQGIGELIKRMREMLLLARSGQNDKNARDEFKALQQAVNELKEEVAKTDQTTVKKLDEVSAKYESEQDKYAREWREIKDSVRSYVRDGISSMKQMAWDATVNIADKIGVGRFTVGNAFRAGRAAYRGAKATGRAVGRGVRAVGKASQWVYNAATAKARDERAQVSALSQSGTYLSQVGPEAAGADKEKKSLFETFAKKHFKHLSDIKKAASGITSSMGRIILGIGSTLAPIILPIVGVVGALAAGWYAGQALYEKYSTKILDGIDWVVNNVKSLGKWISEKWEAVTGFIGGGASKAWEATKGVAKGAAAAVGGAANAVSSGVSSAASAVSGTVSDVIDAGKGALDTARTSTTNAIEAGVNTAGNFAKSAGDWWKQTFRAKDASVNMEGLQPGLKERLAQMGDDYKNATGKTIQVNSAYRSPSEQKQLYDAEMAKPAGARKAVAKPGTSLHNFGYAIDINSQDANRLDSLGLLSKYGIERPVRGEPWHLQPKGVSSAAAMKGVYSADYTSDQGASGSSKGASTKTSAAPDSFRAPKDVADSTTPTDTSTASGGNRSGGSAPGTSVKSSVASVPTFSTNDGVLLAMNMGAIG